MKVTGTKGPMNWGFSLAICACIALPATAQGLSDPIPETIQLSPIQIGLRTVATGLTSPNFLTTAGDGSGRLFVTDQVGQVRVIDGGVLQPTPYLDLSVRLATLPERNNPSNPNQGLDTGFDERGLLGIAFHPNFVTMATSGSAKFYTYHSEGASGTADFTAPNMGGNLVEHHSVITEWTVDDTSSNVFSGSNRELLRFEEPQFNHNGGAMAFGPDGNLYIAIGDGGAADDQGASGSTVGHSSQGNGQDPTNILGSIVRIDPLGGSSANGQYGIPDGNPFANDTTDKVKEIFAYGLRNPFRISAS